MTKGKMDITERIKEDYAKRGKQRTITADAIVEKLKKRPRLFGIAANPLRIQPNSDIEIPDPSRFLAATDSAYASSAYLMKTKMRKEKPLDLSVLEKVTKEDIVVIPGSFDKVENVFSSAGTPYNVLSNQDLPNLKKAKLVFVNCPGDLPEPSLDRLVHFVSNGGYLVTTDWALDYIIQKKFPNTAVYNGNSTPSDMVKIQEAGPPTPYTQGVIEKGTSPVWWLEGSSYPINLPRNSKAKVILTSKEMKKKYGEPTIAFYFAHEKGKVFHFISHFYLQQTKNSENKSSDFAVNQLNLTDDEITPIKNRLSNLNAAQIESTYSSTGLIHNIIIDRIKRDYR